MTPWDITVVMEMGKDTVWITGMAKTAWFIAYPGMTLWDITVVM